MRDGVLGGLLATAIVAPAMVVCCGGGGVFLAAILGGIGGWLSGLGGIATAIAAFGAVLVVREVRRHRAAKQGHSMFTTTVKSVKFNRCEREINR